ncbi:MAG: hypothetical protein JW966_08965 [Anaerolineae bacterium]|nr:hypothetical protein [Anaerolineae bacterium]
MAAAHKSPSNRDLELLSAYIDGEISDHERDELERRLNHDAALRAALADLRETVALVRSLPQLKAPRDFTLDPAVYGRQPSWWQYVFNSNTILQLSGALGAAASIVFLVMAVLMSGDSDSRDAAIESAPQEAPVQHTAVGFVAQTAPASPTMTSTAPPSPTTVILRTATIAPDVAVEEEASEVEAGQVLGAAAPTQTLTSLPLGTPEGHVSAAPAVEKQTAEAGDADLSGESAVSSFDDTQAAEEAVAAPAESPNMPPPADGYADGNDEQMREHEEEADTGETAYAATPQVETLPEEATSDEESAEAGAFAEVGESAPVEAEANAAANEPGVMVPGAGEPQTTVSESTSTGDEAVLDSAVMQPTNTMTSTATSTMTGATTSPAGSPTPQPQSVRDESSGQIREDNTEDNDRWLLVVIGAVLLVVSAALFFTGYRRARHT